MVHYSRYQSVYSADERKILLAESDPETALFTSEMIRNSGFICIVTNDGNETLDVLSKEKVDLVFMNIQLPVMNGFETIRKIRKEKSSSCPNVPVVAITYDKREEVEKECKSAGMNMVISLPTSPEMIKRTINQFMKPVRVNNK